jgi:hypothetical protein
VLGAAVAALAVDDHGAGEHQPGHLPGAAVDGGEQLGGTERVVAHVAGRVGERLAQPDHGGLVADGFDPVEGQVEDARLETGLEVVDVVAQVGGRAVVGLGVQAVEHAHLVAQASQLVDDVAAYEPGAAGNQDLHGQPACPPRRRPVNDLLGTRSLRDGDVPGGAIGLPLLRMATKELGDVGCGARVRGCQAGTRTVVVKRPPDLDPD